MKRRPPKPKSEDVNDKTKIGFQDAEQIRSKGDYLYTNGKCPPLGSTGRTPLNKNRGRWIMRLSWRILTINGTLTAAYDSFLAKAWLAAGTVMFTLIQNVDTNLVQVDGTVSNLDLFLTVGKNVLILCAVYSVIEFLWKIKGCQRRFRKSRRRRMNRSRFNTLTQLNLSVDEFYDDYSENYDSDNDPPDDAMFWLEKETSIIESEEGSFCDSMVFWIKRFCLLPTPLPQYVLDEILIKQKKQEEERKAALIA